MLNFESRPNQLHRSRQFHGFVKAEEIQRQTYLRLFNAEHLCRRLPVAHELPPVAFPVDPGIALIIDNRVLRTAARASGILKEEVNASRIEYPVLVHPEGVFSFRKKPGLFRSGKGPAQGGGGEAGCHGSTDVTQCARVLSAQILERPPVGAKIFRRDSVCERFKTAVRQASKACGVKAAGNKDIRLPFKQILFEATIAMLLAVKAGLKLK